MIPKIIHYCWFGGKEKPKQIVDYINNWKKMLPDYIFKEWNESNFDIERLSYTKEAYEAKKYAFVSDVARLYALLNDGGIYLDTDVEVVKSFNDILDNTAFVGFESKKLVATCVIGSEKNSVFIRDFYSIYENKHFDVHNTGTNVQLLTTLLNKKKKVVYPFMSIDGYVKIYPYDHFVAFNYLYGRKEQTAQTYAIHHYSATWHPWYERIEKNVFNALGLRYRAIIKRYIVDKIS
mgnify:CR=1 FL=1